VPTAWLLNVTLVLLIMTPGVEAGVAEPPTPAQEVQARATAMQVPAKIGEFARRYLNVLIPMGQTSILSNSLTQRSAALTMCQAGG
jgi:hypothetical protein